MTQKKTVERQIGVALWRQIADRIRLSIANGDYDQAGMVPPEIKLASQFGVNRHTVRSALASLADEGLVEAIQGRGTMVRRKERLSFPISRRTRLSQGLSNQVRNIQSTLLFHEELPATPEIAAALTLSLGEKLIRMDTTSSADGRQVSYATSYFPAHRFPDMVEHFSQLNSITKSFAAQGLADYVRISTEIVARHADADELATLRLSAGAIVLETIAVNADPDGVPVQFSRSRFAADRVTLKLET
ncbi:GntR family phosphonate transport system transcriptional regulator [Pararhizobium capsulatum DSM 1112]|uniref:GntR family phosphonate transport system transcriptional regulator n=1 Tax=Pararhizobium capsulatum DSM 1112 TaxID=1121113 RepID=A0ABU0BIL5_9HYPH|nr:phosphonate metabolism transcriptional regulator PhnF [Pararhizobium capsulatum]MDQ0318100.1 GntR family phosphonate transport system transcriptional regulator [Pararhizobium capsulatum DSM 1112]